MSPIVATSGIGTTAPGAKLEVAGTAGTDGIKFPDGTLQTSASGNISLYYTASAATSLPASSVSGAICSYPRLRHLPKVCGSKFKNAKQPRL